MTYETNIPDYQGIDDWHISKAYDAESAAEKAGEHYNEDGDYSLMHGDGVYIRVREVNDENEVVGDIQVFYVTAEQSIDYHSNELTSVTCEQCKAELLENIKAGKVPYRDNFCNMECYKQYRHEKYGCPK